MIGTGSRPASAIRPANTDTKQRRSAGQRRHDVGHLREGQERGDVLLHAVVGEAAHQRRGRSAVAWS